jgi:ATP-dependent helicase/nuclease subunit B
MTHSRLFTIAPGIPFLQVLADAICAGTGSGGIGLAISAHDPLALARTTVYLPTRRSADTFAAILAARITALTGQSTALLPRILPLGGLEEAELDLITLDPAGFPGAEAKPDGTAVPPAIHLLRRQLLLALQVAAWGKSVNRACFGLDDQRFRLVPERFAEAVDLAGRLAELIDTMQVSGVPFSRLAGIGAGEYDRLWEFTLGFLRIAGENWPLILQAEGALDPAERRNRLTEAECARIREGRISGPVIAAGSTGSVPATAGLLKAIAASPQGAVVLPGLDTWLDEGSWQSLKKPRPGAADPAISHPQAMMARLLEGMGAVRADVRPLGAERGPESTVGLARARLARARLASQALRPAHSTALWQDEAQMLPASLAALALRDVRLIEAGDEREEALAVALVLRGALEDPACHAALVTADRGLAERVAIELERWGVKVDDSAGRPLLRSLNGALARQVLDLVGSGFAREPLVALLAHPLLRLGMGGGERARAAMTLEIGGLRGVATDAGFAGLVQAVQAAGDRRSARHAPFPLRRISDGDLALAAQLVARLGEACSPLMALAAGAPADAAAFAAAHLQCLAALTAHEDAANDTAPAAFSGEAGQILEALLEQVTAEGSITPKGDIGDYGEIFAALAGPLVVAPRTPRGTRIAILGLLEARLLDADVMVLAGLNEGVWPPQVEGEPFLNRPMRHALGLPVPERRIGQSAHDLAQGFATGALVMTRAKKAGLTQTVPSRFWQRLQAVVPEGDWQAALARGQDVLALAHHLDAPERVAAMPRPSPRPPARLQPLRLSVTEVETLYRDPYAIHARRILKLDVLEALEMPIGARDRGILLHDIVGEFAKAWPLGLPAEPLARLIGLGEAAFAPLMKEPDVAAFWWPRFKGLAARFIAWEEARRPQIAEIAVEQGARQGLVLPDGETLVLTAQADRIERNRDGSLTILDFKTGSPPSDRQIRLGVAAQLTLEAAMASRGGFGGMAPAPVANVAYVLLKASTDELLAEQPKKLDSETLATMAEEHLSRLLETVSRYRSGEWAFVPHLFPQYMRSDGPYNALARVKEWSRFAASDEDGSPGDEGGEA